MTDLPRRVLEELREVDARYQTSVGLRTKVVQRFRWEAMAVLARHEVDPSVEVFLDVTEVSPGREDVSLFVGTAEEYASVRNGESLVAPLDERGDVARDLAEEGRWDEAEALLRGE